MKSITRLLLVFFLGLWSRAVPGEISPIRLPQDICSMRAKVFQTLGIAADTYRPLEFPEIGRDRGLDFLRERVKNLYPLKSRRGVILADLKRMLVETKGMTGREIVEGDHYLSLQVVHQSTMAETGGPWLTIGNLDFDFTAQGLLEKAYYVEVMRPGDRDKK